MPHSSHRSRSSPSARQRCPRPRSRGPQTRTPEQALTPPLSSDVGSQHDSDEDQQDELEDEDPPENPKKRRYNELRGALNGNLKKAKLSDEYKKLSEEARWISRSISPFLILDTIICDGQRLPADPGAPVGKELQCMSSAALTDLRESYSMLKKTITTIREDEELWTDTQSESPLTDLIATLEKYASRGRSDDLGVLKKDVLGYIPKCPGVESLEINNPNKSARGWSHITTARLLCPANRLVEFDGDPMKFCRDVEHGIIKLDSGDLPCFLYAGGRFNPIDVEEGLLRGEFLLSVYRCIFTGPRTAMKESRGPSAGRPSKAKKSGMTKVTPRTIAYAAVLGRFSISGQDEWSLEDGSYKLEDLFKTILEAFDDLNDPWCVSTLGWWNQWVFGHADSNNPDVAAGNSGPSIPSIKATLHQQRAARRAALASDSINSTSNPAATNNPGDVDTNAREAIVAASSDSEEDEDA
ncbi:hypothetical protein PHLCEN_2v11050 [Hermanssonia centrifuga]|uniref:Uncharacterized protein n=1 Tax=Hermanssonia centrifuga TaxID=98765 RepID=A0A2R6NL07_9APHY|nr:hypothetical protein PHLCEN_2v11050 [Hermanssonia centrifuga]